MKTKPKKARQDKKNTTQQNKQKQHNTKNKTSQNTNQT